MKNNLHLFLGFFRAGMLGFGGGPASIPLIQLEVVEKYKWMDDDEFGDILAIANALPGPIATKLAGYIGYRVSGTGGMLVAITANIFPTIFLMIVLLASLSSIRDFDWVQGMTAAVIPVVAMMMGTLTWRFIKKSGEGFGWGRAIVFGAILFIILEILNIHPGIVIVLLLLLALSLKNNKKGEQR